LLTKLAEVGRPFEDDVDQRTAVVY